MSGVIDWKTAFIENEPASSDNLSEFVEIAFASGTRENYPGYRVAAHGAIYAPDPAETYGHNRHAAILLQMRFDGKIGFPGGELDQGPEEAVAALNRELEEEINLDIKRFAFSQADHVISHVNEKHKIVLHFYCRKVALSEFVEIEKAQVGQAFEWGRETMGTVRVPLYKFEGGPRGFPMFLRNQFAGCAKLQLLQAISSRKIVPQAEFLDMLKQYNDMINNLL